MKENKKYVILDFEFNNTQEQHYNIVCVCGLLVEGQVRTDFQYWLHKDSKQKKAFKSYFNELIKNNYILIAWSATAELRCLHTLGIDIDTIRVLDPQVEFKLYANCDRFKTWRLEAEAKAKARAKLQGKKFVASKGRFSLDVACLVLLGEVYEEKKDMQCMIVSSSDFTSQQQEEILLYCAKDVTLTLQVFQAILKYMLHKHRTIKDDYFYQALRRGDYVRACTWVEYYGYPVDKDMLSRISRNATEIQEGFIREYDEDLVECFIRTITKTKRNKETISFKEQKFSNAVFAEKLIKFGLDRNWPRSPKSNQFLFDIETLEDKKNVHDFIGQLVSLKRKLSCLKYLTKQTKQNDPLTRSLVDSVSSQDRIHCYVNPFGTTTGRNAPPAAKFIFAQSSWERVLVKPKPGKVILGLDYSAQEILIAGLLTGDQSFVDDYFSGDPYTNFAVNCELFDSSDIVAYKQGLIKITDLKKKYASFRDKVLKPVFLGLGYGLGRERLANSIERPQWEADMYYKAHKNRYAVYWKDTQYFVNHMKRTGEYYALGDDWGIYESDNYTTLVNLRIQALGGVVLRKLAIELTKKKYRERNIQLICLLHDAVYVELDVGNEQLIAKEISDLMVKIFHEVIPSERKIGVEYSFYFPDDLWIEKKAVSTWENIKSFVI